MKTIRQDPQDDERKKGVFWKRAGFWVILLLLAAASVFYRDSWQDIREGIRQITRRELLCCIGISVSAYFLEGMTIACMMCTVAPSFPVKRGTRIAYLCEFYRLITFGSGSGVAEIYYLHKSGIETGTATVLTMIQYICKRIAVMALGVIGFAVLLGGEDTQGLCRKYAGFMLAGCVISLGVIAAFLCVALSERILQLICKAVDWASGKLPSWEERFLAWKEQAVLLSQSGRMILGKKVQAAGAVILQIGKLLLLYSIPAYLLQDSAPSHPVQPGWWDFIFLMAVVYMLSGIIPAPSGMGSLEFVFLLFFSALVETQAAVPVILVFRFVTWIIPFLIGGVLYIFMKMQSDS